MLIFSGFAVAFAWAAKNAALAEESDSAWAQLALMAASFPDMVGKAFDETQDRVTGDYKDKAFRVARDQDWDMAGFTPVHTVRGPELQGLQIRANRSRLPDGWRVLSGAFDLDGEVRNAILLMSPDLEVVQSWILDEPPVDHRLPVANHRKLVHGLEVLRDGSIVFTYNGSVSIQKWNRCGEREWATGGWFHHAVTLNDREDAVWTFSAFDKLAKVALDDGQILKEISVDQIIRSNPRVHILELRRLLANDLAVNSRQTEGRWLADPLHFNDVDPLPDFMAHRFDGFDAGDLLISARSLDLVFVLDPDTLQIKWWHIGHLRRQHDPDWLPSGQISIYNNRMGLDFSEILLIDPHTNEISRLLNGDAYSFYSRIRGKHQHLENGGLVVTSPQQGRAFEIGSDGQVNLELLNLRPDSRDAYVITELRWLPQGYFEKDAWRCHLLS
jgi:hypothetical protein